MTRGTALPPALAVMLLLGCAAAARGQTPDAEQVRQDEKLLQKLRIGTDGDSLLAYLRERTYPETNPGLMEKLLGQLGDSRFAVRERAYAEITKYGSGALFSLQAAKEDGDTERKNRVLELLGRLEEKANPEVQAAVARLISHRRPEGACGVLLNYLPFADPETVGAIEAALAALAVRGGEADPLVVAALGDEKFPLRRRVAAVALVRAGATGQEDDLRPLLADPDPRVRVQVALALTRWKGDKIRRESIDALIGALADLPPEDLWEAEMLLVRLAGEDSPEVSLGDTEAERKQARDAWAAWWAAHQEGIDLAKLDREPQTLGYVALVYQEPTRVVGGKVQRGSRKILELDPNKKERWSFELAANENVVAAEVTGDKRVLLAEYTQRRVTERDFKGEIKWQHGLPTYPIAVQRLDNGNTFVAMRNKLVEYDRNGKEVFAHDRRQSDVFRATKLPNGTIVFVTSGGAVNFMDPRKEEITRTFNVGSVGTYYGGLQVLRDGHILVPLYTSHKVVEYAPTGQAVWEANVQWPNTAVRLPNGHTMVGSINSRRLVELDRKGNEVWSHQYDGQIYQVSVR